VVVNLDTYSNEVDASIREDPYAVWAFGDQNLFQNCAFSGKDSSDTVQINGGLCLGGRDSRATACRYLDCDTPARTISITGAVTDGIHFDRMGIRDSLQTYAVSNDNDAVFTRVDIADGTSITQAMAGTQKDGEDARFEYSRKVHGSLNQSSFNSGRELSISDDSVASLEFDGTTYGILVVGSPTALSGPGMVAFRVGSSNYTSLLTTNTAMEVTTGILAGTTGTDTKLTISTHTDNKIYIENRTGALRVYNVVLLSVDDGGKLLAAQ